MVNTSLRQEGQELDDRHAEACALLAAAEAQAASGDADAALQTADEALDLFLELKDKGMEARVLIAMSSFHLQNRQPSKALSDAEDALEIYQMLRSPEETQALRAVFAAHVARADLRKAKLVASEAVRRFRELGNSRGQVEAAQMLVDLFFQAQRWEEVISAAQKCLTTCRELGDAPGEAKALTALCGASLKAGRIEKALHFGTEALTRFKALQDANEGIQTDKVQAMQHVVDTHLKEKDFEAALQVATDMREHFQHAQHAKGEAEALLCACMAQFMQGNMDQAGQAASRAQLILSEDGDMRSEAKALRLLGEVYWRRKEHKAAVRVAERARALYREVEDKIGEACALYMVAQNSVHVAVKEGARVSNDGQTIPKPARDALDKANRAAEAGVKIARGTQRLNNVLASVLGSVAQVRLLNMQPEESLKAADEAVLLFRESGDYGGEANSLMLSCDALRVLRQFQDAAEAADEALMLYRHTEDQKGQEMALEVLEWLKQFLQPAPRQPGQTPWQPSGVVPISQPLPQQAEPGKPQEASVARTIQGGPALDVKDVLDMTLVRDRALKIAMEITGAEDGEIEADTPLMEAGLTSNSAILLRDTLTRELAGVNLPVTLVFDYPSINAMSELIVESSMKAIKN